MDVVELVKRQGGNISAAAREAGIDRGTVRRRLAKANAVAAMNGQPQTGVGSPPQPTEQVERRETGDALSLTYCGRKVSTPAELMEAAGIDSSLWEITESTVNQWEVGGKKKNGRGKPETLWAMPLLQIKVKLRRRAPKAIQEAIRDLLAEAPAIKLPPPRTRNTSDAHLFEVSLYDAHFGKLCWGKHTGTPYDLQIARDDYLRAVDDLMARAENFPVDRVLLPLGNDFFHVDNWLGTTARGTAVDSTDDRFQKVFREGYRAIEQAIRRLREIAPVEVVWIPGNHDPATSWYLCEVLAATFRNDKYVAFDSSPPQRKYRSYGPALIGLTHGNDIKLDKLPLIMAAEAPEAWAQSTQRAWHVGHFHKKAETKHAAGDTYNGVSVAIIPSISGTDAWHYEQGWVANERRAEAYVWSRREGYVAQFSVLARSAGKAAA